MRDSDLSSLGSFQDQYFRAACPSACSKACAHHVVCQISGTSNNILGLVNGFQVRYSSCFVLDSMLRRTVVLSLRWTLCGGERSIAAKGARHSGGSSTGMPVARFSDGEEGRSRTAVPLTQSDKGRDTYAG